MDSICLILFFHERCYLIVRKKKSSQANRCELVSNFELCNVPGHHRSHLETSRDWWATERVHRINEMWTHMSPSSSALRRRRRPPVPERPRHLLHASCRGRQERTLMGAARHMHRIGDGAVRGGEEQPVMAASKSTRTYASQLPWPLKKGLGCWFSSHIDRSMGTQQGLGNEHENCCAQHELTRKDNTRT